MANSPILVWIRRDLRLADHGALAAAAASGRPVIPVFIHDEIVEALGAAPKWRFGLGIEAFAKRLRGIGSDLVLRRGAALEVLQALIAETGAGEVYWQRAYDPASQARDRTIKAALKQAGIEARSFAGHVLFEPWTVETKTGGFYKVYTPFWNTVKQMQPVVGSAAVGELRAPESWPASDDLADWAMGAAMNRGAAVVAAHVCVGEEQAQARLERFIEEKVQDYGDQRDLPGVDATSRLSENLTYGEISPLACWQAGWRALQDGARGAERFLKEIVWRDFAYHLLHHTPHIETRCWRPEWEDFGWNTDETDPGVIAWKQGHTGVEFVDAAMRELWVTGIMHNRARMIVGSFLTKHLLSDWRIGQRWFADQLIDWDPASNAMGWQWIAGCGPDAAPYFRVFNPDGQADKFDADRAYRRAWIAEGQSQPPQTATSFYEAVPSRWGLSPDQAYPSPVIGLKQGRERALERYQSRRS